MESVSLNGEKYIKASKIAKELGYTSDYVGQLCREGHVKCERVGRGWFVSEKSIRDHKKNRYRSTTKKSKDELEEAKEEQREKQSQSGFVNNEERKISYEPDESELVPTPIPQKQTIDDEVAEYDNAESDTEDPDDLDDEKEDEMETSEEVEDDIEENTDHEEDKEEQAKEYQNIALNKIDTRKTPAKNTAVNRSKRSATGTGNFKYTYDSNNPYQNGEAATSKKTRPMTAIFLGLVVGVLVSSGIGGLFLGIHNYLVFNESAVVEAYQVDFVDAYKYYENRLK